jgi:hypothetical protein
VNLIDFIEMIEYTGIVRCEEKRNKRSGLDRDPVAKILRELRIQRVQEGAVAARKVCDLTSNQKRRKRIFSHCCFIQLVLHSNPWMKMTMHYSPSEGNP